MAMHMVWLGFVNKAKNKPYTISFEITHACTANCWHCNWGGPIKEKRLDATGYAESEKVIDMRNRGYPVFNTPGVLWKYYQFLAEGGIPGCQAGRRFLVINPDGRLTPCAMVMAYFDTQEDMLESFTKQNTCEQCYISTRANAEKTFRETLLDNPAIARRLLRPWRA
jgi:MoaA/NifB/PqqE/SkfB family radical SAM enzyme